MLHLWIKILIHIRTHRVRSNYWISSLRIKFSSLRADLVTRGSQEDWRGLSGK
jgi:hypothetical protein